MPSIRPVAWEKDPFFQACRRPVRRRVDCVDHHPVLAAAAYSQRRKFAFAEDTFQGFIECSVINRCFP